MVQVKKGKPNGRVMGKKREIYEKGRKKSPAIISSSSIFPPTATHHLIYWHTNKTEQIYVR